MVTARVPAMVTAADAAGKISPLSIKKALSPLLGKRLFLDAPAAVYPPGVFVEMHTVVKRTLLAVSVPGGS